TGERLVDEARQPRFQERSGPVEMNCAVDRFDQHRVHLADHLFRFSDERHTEFLHLLGEAFDAFGRKFRFAGAANDDLGPFDELALGHADVVNAGGEGHAVRRVEVENAKANHGNVSELLTVRYRMTPAPATFLTLSPLGRGWF